MVHDLATREETLQMLTQLDSLLGNLSKNLGHLLLTDLTIEQFERLSVAFHTVSGLQALFSAERARLES